MLRVALLGVIFLTKTSVAQTLRNNISMPYLGLGAYSTNQYDAFSFTSNQASLAQIKSTQIGVAGEQRFLTKELGTYGAAAAIKTSLGNIGVQLGYTGFATANEQKLGLAYARSLGKAIDIGIQFNYLGLNIPSYFNASAVNAEIGVIAHVSEKFNVGVHAYNPVGASFSKINNEKVAAAYKLGLGYDASENFYCSAEVVKEENLPVAIIGAAQYQFKKQFFARGGFRSDNSTGFAGIGFVTKGIRIDIASSFHPQLGISPGIVLMYQFKKKTIKDE
jgi:hypothetical protein